ncbi:mechanosensitive ion channel family protein [Mucilaginibacter auburnensis]|uniref:Mechanosensitive ion channel-like protein n=1 Tax=Mucilaginibacter auburnensis TaxID=1457233 RepID=A0A2H9VQL6_9SPHI|nr:mechanosensitive ion channel domain-containing protein [Mucilaginibacter auburnensis]PJJ83100.1 mechanosensitive ion channel-like protein [Mucilaginibacter auburnensis]
MDRQLQILSRELPGWAWNICLVAATLLLGFILKLLLTRLLRYYKNTKDYSLFRSVITHLSRPLNHFIPLLTLNALLPFLIFEGAYLANFKKLIEIMLIISFADLLINTVRVFEDFVYHKYDLNKVDNLEERKIQTQLRFVRKVITTLIVLITIAVVLLSFDNVRKLGAGLLTGVGIGGIIIGFAAQKSLGNFLAGFQIAFTQPIRIDDVLVVEGEWGRVEDITLTYVVLNIWDQRRLILPITYFIEKPFQNWTRTTAELLGTVEIYVDYTCPVSAVRDELTRILNTSDLWDRRVNVLQVWEAKESTMMIRAIVSAKNASNLVDLRCYVRESLIAYLQQQQSNSLPKLRIDNPQAG